MESYFWAMALFDPHQFGYQRKTAAKIITLITAIDDVYDIYGTLDELELFTQAFQRFAPLYIYTRPPSQTECTFAFLREWMHFVWD